MVMPKELQTQAISLAHEGHMQPDGTLRQLRESQWFRNMRAQVQAYITSCKYQTANPRNPQATSQKVVSPHSDGCLLEVSGSPHDEKYGDDGGPPYNGHGWEKWVRSWGSKPKKTTLEHPPANGTVERPTGGTVR